MRLVLRRTHRHRVNMGKSALRVLVVTGLLKVALFYGDIYVHQRKIWSEAREYCAEHYTDMSSISSQEEHEALLALREQGGSPLAWIGLYRDDNDTWKWTDGRNTSFLKWGQKNITEEDNRCAVQSKNKKMWHKKDCREKMSFYCSHVEMVLVKENKTWEEAMELCRQHQRELVSMNSESALDKTLQISRAAQTTRVWTGLRYLADTWLWVGGGTMNYQAWGKEGMPHCPALLRRCGALSLEGGHWESWDCAEKLNFVCK